MRLWWLVLLSVLSPLLSDAQQLSWTDRRPIAQWFMASAGSRTATNPRGWRYGGGTIVPQSAFTTAMLNATDFVIGIMNAMNPRPQGIILWDLEGQEFFSGAYIGDPRLLSGIAPEMDAVIDQMRTKLRTAGYRVGITIRSSHIMSGTALPATCRSDAGYVSQVQWRWDTYIKFDEPATFRWFTCMSTNTWVQEGANTGGAQSMYDVDADILAEIQAKVQYAVDRWSASMFYFDANLYSTQFRLNASIWAALYNVFPQILMIPEHTLTGYFDVTTDYEISGAPACPSQAIRDVYPRSFCVMNAMNLNLDDPTVRADLLKQMRLGNSTFVHGWWANPTNTSVLEIWRHGHSPPLTVPSTTGAHPVGLSATPGATLEGWITAP